MSAEPELTPQERAAYDALPQKERDGVDIMPPRIRKLWLERLALPEDERRRRDDEARRQREAEELAERQAAIARRLQTMVPRKFKDAGIENLAVGRWVEQFLAGGKQSLLLVGPTGRGKSHHAWAAIIKVLTAGYVGGVIYRRTATLLAELRPREDAAPYDLMTRLMSVGLLVLDDLGAEKASKWSEEQLYQIVDDRYMHCRPIFATSNVVPKDLSGAVGGRVASRIGEMCRVVPLTGPDRRLG